MNTDVALNIARRFVTLPLDKRKTYLERMYAENISPANLPIPATQSSFERLPLSFAQQRQWFLWQLEPNSAAYHIPAALRLKGDLDIEALRCSFEHLIERHETLRTCFRQEGETASQVIQPNIEFELPCEALEDEGDVQTRVEAEIQRPFDLEHGPLLRVKLLRLAADDHVLVLTMHHIVSDGWSMPVMVDELIALYEGYRQGQAVELPVLPIQYADYAIWQRNWMEAGERERQLSYWKAQLGDEQPVLELPTDRPRPAVQSHAGASLDIELSDELCQSLKRLAQEQGVTLFMLLLASFHTLLHRYSGQNDIRVGVPIANRTRVETEGLIGFFVNTQVLRAEFDLQMTFGELLQQVKQAALGAQAHQDLPFEQLVEALQPERSLSHGPLFQAMFNHQRVMKDETRCLPELTVESLSWESHTTHFDLTLSTFESERRLQASLSYATELFDQATIERLAEHWRILLDGVCRTSQQCVSELPILGVAERQSILQRWGGQQTDPAAIHQVHQVIAQWAERTPNAPAVICEEQQLTYQQLDEQANRLAHRLIELGVGPEVRVAVAMRRSVDIVMAFLAVLKAGGAYVPLDVAYPQERLLYMMNDCAAPLLLTQKDLLGSLPIPDGVIALAVDGAESWQQCPATPPQCMPSEKNLAYVIYTSGSTGQPKGVAVAHGPLAMHCLAIGERYEMSAADCELQFMSLAFDGAHERWLTALTHGARLLLRGDELWTPEQTYRVMQLQGVTVTALPPVYMQQLAEHAERDGNPPAVRIYCFGGDAVSQESYELAWRALRPQYLFNGYGPTETVVTPLLWKASRGDACDAPYAPIGTLLGRRCAYVLDAGLNLLSVGLPGELYLGGEGVARGYLGRPGLTAERFVPDPFDENGGARLYRSGDLTRTRPDGLVDYLGRVDHQVKIRGFRIELGEIEAQLLQQDSVREAVVLAQEASGGKQLVAYLVLAEGDVLGDDGVALREMLRSRLKASLPDYMVPVHFVLLEKLPLTPNGKLDRKALPAPDVSQGQQAYVAPITELEQQVAAIWADVLTVERVGLADNFFELGGHSLLATQVVSRVRHALNIDLPLRSLFEAPQLADFLANIEQAASASAPALVRVERDKPLALSYAQQRQWFLWQLEPGSAAYHIPAALRLKGELDTEALRRSFEHLIERHETLRTCFRQEGETAIQVIHPAGEFKLSLETLDDSDEQTIRAKVEAEVQVPFDLEHGPLLRVKLLRLAPDDHVLVLTMHHIVSDGWSVPVMVDELIALYEGYRQGQSVELPVLPIQYADYAIWQRNWMEAGERERQLSYWKAQLGEEQPVLELPTDRPRPAVQSHAGASLDIELSDELCRSLKRLAQEQGVTLFMLLLASFQTLLHRYSGQNDIRVGVPIANRTRVETEGLIGFFVNTQVLRAEFDLQMTFGELLAQVKQAALGAQAHQDLPFEQLVEALQPERSLSHSPLFQVMFNYQMAVKGESRCLPSLAVEDLSWDSLTAQFDLSLDTFEDEAGLSASLNYATALFDLQSAERLARHWRTLLEGVVQRPGVRVAELALLGEEERRQIVREWNCTQVSYPSDQCIHRLIEAQVERHPEATALVCGEQSLSYRELNLRANRLAYRLRELGVGPDVLVGIAVARGLDMVVGLLGILKAGGAYVPLDPEYPQERLAYMLEHSGAKLLLTQLPLLEQLPVTDIRTWCLDRDWHELECYPTSNLDSAVLPEHVAYCIYTSGSTGKPKGVAVRQRALVNFLTSMAHEPGLQASDRVLALTSLSFDIAGLELYLPLLVGASVVLLGDRENKDAQALLKLVERQLVTAIQATPSTWRMLLDVAPPEALRCCKLLSGGEALAPDLASQLLAQAGHVWNLYGPTETTIWSGLHYLDEQSPTPWLGKPIANTTLYVVEQALMPAPTGVAGELLIGGDGLARGYLHRPDLTAERFIPDPFDPSEQGGGRLYRTGDLARYSADGVIDYVGRIDHQVKIRGFRIELGEIEAKLQEHAEVREAVVIDVEGASGRQLAAYLVSTAQESEQQNALRGELREHLKASLPDYMVPAYLLFLDALPLTPNGKLDRKALPAPDVSQGQQAYVAPITELEQQVAAIWADVLTVERAGLADNFFELGGHSLLATRVVSRVRHALNIDLPLRSLFEAPQLADFLVNIEQAAGASAPALVRVARDKPLALSYAQQRQWFLWQLEPTSAAYHIPAALRLKGDLDIEALRCSFEHMIERHETLRTCFRQEGETAIQVIQPNIAFELPCDALEDEGDIQARVEAEIQRPFDLEHSPLLRVKLLRLASDDHVLVLTMHHIVSDGWSMPVMVDELIALYEGYRQGQSVALPVLPIQYADYAIWQRNWMEAGERERQLSYWKAQLGDEQPVLELPTDRPRPAVQSHAGASLNIELSDELCRSLKRLAQEQGVTLFMLLLASFQTLLHRYSGQNDIRVGVPIANRTRVETEGLIGFFVNTQVLRAEFDLQMTFGELLAQVKQAALGAQAHQDLPFEQLVEALQPERSLSHSPLFQVMFNHQSQVSSHRHELSGLTVDGLSWEVDTAKFDLMLETSEHGQGIAASLNYAIALFDPQSIAGMARCWRRLLEVIVRQPQQRIAELPLLNPQEQLRLAQCWNPAYVQHSRERCIHQVIEQRAAATPTAIAVVMGSQTLTYEQLNQSANQFAHALRERGIGPDVRVGLAVERGLEMVVGILAILKAGGAYVPLDPEYPEDRLAYMIKDSSIELLLTQAHLQEHLPIPAGVRCMLLDAGQSTIEQYSRANPALVTMPANLAYVIYTSGSTGKPKGTLLSHYNVIRLFQSTEFWFGFDERDVWTVFHSYAFDFSVWELFGALLHGGKAVLVAKEVARSPEDLHGLLVREQVTVLNQTPSSFKHLMAFACDRDMASAKQEPGLALRYVVFGGEALDVASLRPWFARFGDASPQLVNMYGITETTVHVSYRPLSLADLAQDAVSPIGEVIPDLSWYLLDGQLSLTTPGCHGELHIGQAGLARGYHQRPGLTAERFIPDPFDRSEQGGGRLYRTGDLARDRGEGMIEYVGRIDHQVKIRGFRIELGEIEARLQQCAEVREAVVLDMDGSSGKQLVAYVITEPGQSQEENVLRYRLREQLKALLPDYMVPAHWVFLEKLPLTANGKLDRKALPRPDANQLLQGYVLPQTELEQRIAAIWAEVLGVEQVGLHDNFFELGGDSIISIQVVNRARQAGIRFTPKQLFQHQTVQGLASVAAQGIEEGLQVDQRPVTGETLLLPIQQYFFDEDIPQRHHWNQALLLAPGQALDPIVLEAALQALVVHHDALRLSFTPTTDGRWTARYRDEASQQPILWRARLQAGAPLEAYYSEAQDSLDLQQGPLIRAALVDVDDDCQRLLLVIHHLVVDGVSWRILLEDLQSAYAQLAAGQSTELPAKTHSTKDWAQHLQTYATSTALQQELGYWQRQLENINTGLPCDNPSGSLQRIHAAEAGTWLDRDYTQKLLQQAPAAYRTQVNDLLLTALARVIARWTGREHVLVQLEGHGREELFESVDLTRTVGWFTSMYPVKLSPVLAMDASIKQIKEQLRAIPNKGIGFGVLRYLGNDQIQAELAQLPVPRLTFNYLGQFDGSFGSDVPQPDAQRPRAFLSPVAENSGNAQSASAPLSNWLTINGQVYGGELSLTWSYSQAMFSRATVESLARDYAQELRQLIDHCISSEAGGLTPSDLIGVDMDQQSLDCLLDEIL